MKLAGLTAPLPLVGRGRGWGRSRDEQRTPPCLRSRSDIPPHKGEGDDRRNPKSSVGLFALRVKEWWEAGPPRCLLRRVGLVPTSINLDLLTEWVWRPPAGGQKSGGPTALPPPSIPTKAPRGLGTDGSCSTFDKKRRGFRMTASFLEQMQTIYTHLGM